MIASIFGIVPPPSNTWLDYVSAATSVFIAIIGFFALKQVSAAITQAKCALQQTKLSLEQIEISRKDIALRSKREALELSIKACEGWANDIVPLLDKTHLRLKELNFVTPSSIDPNFPFINTPHESAARVWNELPFRTEIIKTLNKMEAFAMYFATDLASEEVAFLPTGAPFCNACERLAVFIGAFRREDAPKLYNHIVKLYGIWKPRLEHTLIQNAEQALQAKKNRFPQSKPRPPIGTEN